MKLSSKITDLCLGTLFFVMLINLQGCAKKADQGSRSNDTQEIYIATAQTAADEAVESVSESGAANSLLLMQNQEIGLTPSSISRSCAAANNNATVTLTFSGTETLQFQKNLLSAQVDISTAITRSGTETRLWSQSGGSVGCDGTNSFAAINWSSLSSGLQLSVNLNRVIERNKTITITKTAGTTTRNAKDNVTVTGERSVSFSAATPVSTNVEFTKTITSSTTRQRYQERPNGTIINGTSSATITQSAPLVVKIVRNASTQALMSKTIQSGTVNITDIDGAVTACSFTNVAFDMASANKCLPTQGSIECLRKASANATDTLATILIEFGQNTLSTVSVSYDGGTPEDFSNYNVRGCDFE